MSLIQLAVSDIKQAIESFELFHQRFAHYFATERLAEMSHSRYWMERAIQDAKGEAGLDEYELRSWRGWYHHMTMTILAMLFLLELQLDWKPKAPELTLQDVQEILEVILPKREITPEDIP